jgi:hypothetical protein
MLIFRLSTRTPLASALCAIALCAVSAPIALAQPKSAPAPFPIAVPTSDQLADVREQLVTLLRMSPTLVQVVEADPTLLADQDYVSRSNPQLAQFLAQHPEIARNPDFYLFANIGGREGHYVQPLHRAGTPRDIGNAELHREYVQNTLVLLTFVGSVGALLWLIRLLLENRRWSRVFRQQTEIHGKLIDRFATNQELLEYMNTESGRRFLEASPIPIDPDRSRALPGGLSRVIGPLQLGIVLTMLGIGLLIVEHSLHEYAAPFLLAGMVALMPGLGFIISAIVTWRLSARLEFATPTVSENRQ